MQSLHPPPPQWRSWLQVVEHFDDDDDDDDECNLINSLLTLCWQKKVNHSVAESTSSNTSSQLVRLPPEIKYHIFTFLSPKDLIQLRRTCKHFAAQGMYWKAGACCTWCLLIEFNFFVHKGMMSGSGRPLLQGTVVPLKMCWRSTLAKIGNGYTEAKW